MKDGKYGFKGSLKGIPIAFEVHGDGSVTLCKEIVDQILNDKSTPGWLRVLLTASEQRMTLAAQPVPQMPEDFVGFTDADGDVLDGVPKV
jgi:hypothetical protein